MTEINMQVTGMMKIFFHYLEWSRISMKPYHCVNKASTSSDS